MEKADVEQSSDAVTRDAEKHAETDNVAPDKPAQEEEQQQAKARPKRVASFQDYLRVFQYATKWDFFAYAAGVLASIGAGITLPLMNVVFGNFVGDISDFTNAASQSQEGFRKRADQLSLYMFALFLGRLGLNYINKFAFRMIGIRISSAIRLHYLTALLGQSIHVLDSMPPGYATTTITSTSNTLQLGISEKLGVFFEYNATIVAAIIIAFTRNWALTLVTSSAILFIGLTVSLLLPLIVKGHGRITDAEAKSSAVASETFASIRMIAACGAEGRMVRKYGISVDEAKKHAQRTSPFISLQFGLIFFSVFSAFALAFWYGTKSMADNRGENVGTIVIVLMSVMMVVFSLERTSTPLLAVSKATVAAAQFFTVIDAPQPDKGHLKDPEVSATDDIVFEKVTFAYPSRPHVKILDELDLRIEAGKINAIVGPSGSGKSTVVGLIERWYTLKEQYVIAEAVEQQKDKKKKKASDEEEEIRTQDPEDTGPPVKLSGTLTTNGHALDEIDLKWWRSQIGLVQQEPFLFNDTIFHNVANGLIGTQWENEPEEKKRELVKEACVEAFADEFVDKLPQGYDTLVGDSGAKLSGGQRQRIAIARSIVRKPKILILDEATSAIDVRGERIVQAALDRVAQNRTTITIAHRLSTIKKADRIIVFKKGKVVEEGTHESLIALEGGVYSGLVQAQALSLGGSSQSDESDEKQDAHEALAREKSLAVSEAEAQAKTNTEQQRNIFNSFGRLFYETKSHWYLMFLTIIFAACAGAATPLQAWLFAKLIVVFQFTGAKLLSESRFWSLMWFILAIGVGCAYFGTLFFSTRMASIIRAKYQKQYFEAILYQKTSYFDDEDHSHGTMTARASGDPQRLEELMGANMASVYIAIFNLSGSIAIAFTFGWKLALVGTAVVMPILLVSSFWRFKYEMQFEKMNNEVFAESSKFASESIGAFRTVTSLTLEGPISSRFETLCKGHVKTAFKKARWVSLLFGFADSCTLACQSLIFYYGSRLLASGEYKLENYFVCFMAIMNASESAGQSFGFGPNAAQVTAASNRILNTRDTMIRDRASGIMDLPREEGGMKIELQDVHFKYPTRDIPVFRGLNLTIEKGQFAALVGASGCGKTSIISLLERFYDLDKGRILCNGQDISEVNIFNYRRHLSLVAQEPTLFQAGTLRDNIILGVDESTVTDAQIHQACRDASIHDFIASLPEGYNTNIGSRGVSLSGGQKQRVAIARALLRNPDILLLDEATSSLDSESEKLVQAAFERAGKGRTMVVVAHRLATVQNADVIFVLGEGKLLEKGSHVELLKRKGVYWQMCQSQALDR
ncbi:P-loop containing nucleoside triphosphate hydrolase protein [Trichoderma longibrachiatum ATCC 18648]|uniref:P-loop containing nucleoside triphosphate hydrolase protein n=1 Tax=Trichoderma longibrachiatum ATCC 18648 TaxID=983965 RepID=A0A2T4CJ73_TRILO|nr:P-loop containing nucleoside triphosphate hydrolase protein [Trichoderma longibrachiatum ATCC 18648]